MNPCSLRLDGDGLDFALGGAGNARRGASGEGRRRPCAERSLLLVAAEEARVRTVWGRGRGTTETADSDDPPAAGDVVGTFCPGRGLTPHRLVIRIEDPGPPEVRFFPRVPSKA